MKLAVVHLEASTGGWAYIYNLIRAMKDIDKMLEITLLTNSIYATKNEYISLLKNMDIKIINSKIKSYYKFKLKKKCKNNFINSIINKVRKHIYDSKQKPTKKLINILKEQDIVFYSWPYGIMPFNIDKKTYFIPHDFIYTHCFSSRSVYTKNMVEDIFKYHKEFLKLATPIVSSDFIAKELKTTFPEYKENINIVYLPSLSNLKQEYNLEKNNILKKYGIDGDYILSANNMEVHKNLGQIVSAMYYVKQKYPNIKLVLTGYGTEDFNGIIDSPLYFNWLDATENRDVVGLGVVNNEDFSVILENAKILVTTSLCEAGSGSALDAWSMGVPVVMSDIEAFRNQVKFLGTTAEFCNPRNNEDVARGILKLLDNPEKSKEQGLISKNAMERYNWHDVGKKYLEIFKNGLNE